MSGLLSALAVVGGVVMVLTILHWIIEALQRGASIEERLKEVSHEAEVAAKRAEEMLKERSREDVARDLDAGEF